MKYNQIVIQMLKEREREREITYSILNLKSNLAAVILDRFSIFLTFILIDFNFRSTGKEIRYLAYKFIAKVIGSFIQFSFNSN